jgi:hypothetical protein
MPNCTSAESVTPHRDSINMPPGSISSEASEATRVKSSLLASERPRPAPAGDATRMNNEYGKEDRPSEARARQE